MDGIPLDGTGRPTSLTAAKNLKRNIGCAIALALSAWVNISAASEFVSSSRDRQAERQAHLWHCLCPENTVDGTDLNAILGINLLISLCLN